MDAELLEAFAECDEIKAKLVLVGRQIDSVKAKRVEMQGELALKTKQLGELRTQFVELQGTLAPISQKFEESKEQTVEISLSLALRTQQLAKSNNERDGARADLELRTQQLVEANIELERFAYITAHDLKEPVRTVVSFSQLLQRHMGADLDDESQQYLGFIITGAHRMGDQVRALMSYLLMSGDQTATIAVDLDVVVRDACDNLRDLIDERTAQFEIGLLPTVAGNRVLLTEVFQNLIANAIKYTPADRSPRIKISADRVDGLWNLGVSDEGIGIAPEYQQRIFNIFERLDSGSSYLGRGIGLAVCKGIIERMGGKIWVESEEGQGATFIFSLRNCPTTD